MIRYDIDVRMSTVEAYCSIPKIAQVEIKLLRTVSVLLKFTGRYTLHDFFHFAAFQY